MFAPKKARFLGAVVASVAAGVLAGGWVMSFKVLFPKFDKLNPISDTIRVRQCHRCLPEKSQ